LIDFLEAEMKKILAISLVTLAAGCMADRPMETSHREARGGAASLAAALGDRVQAGPPQNCVSERVLEGNRSAGEGAIIFSTKSSGLVYVNQPPAGCPELDSSRALRVRTPSTQICRGDIVSVFDPVSGFDYGSCGLGDFVPYRRPA